MKTVSGSFRVMDRQNRAVTPSPKLAKSSVMVLLLTLFCGCWLNGFPRSLIEWRA